MSVLEKRLIWFILAASGLLLVVPLAIFPSTYFPYIIIKTIVARVIIEVMVVAYLYLLTLNNNYLPKLDWLTKAITLFLVVAIVTTITSQGAFRSFWGNWERMGGLFNLLHYFAWFYILIAVVKKSHYWRYLFQVTLVTNLLMSIYAALQHVGWDFFPKAETVRAYSSMGNAAYLGAYALLHLFIALFLLVERSKATWLEKMWYGISAFFSLYAIYVSGTRGAQLALVISLPIFIVLSFILKFWRQKPYVYLVGGAVVAFSFWIFLFFYSQSTWVSQNYYLKRLVSYDLVDNTIQTRLMSWSWGLKGFLDRPILGYGLDNFAIPFNKYFEAKFYDYAGSEIWFDHAHNTLVDLLTNLGIFGLLAYLSIFVALFYQLAVLYRQKTLSGPTLAFLLVLFCSYFVQNLFVFDCLSTYLVSLLLWAFVVYLSSVSVERVKVNSKVVNSASWLLIVIVVIGGLIINSREVKANSLVFQSYLLSSRGKAIESIKMYEQAYDVAINKLDPALLIIQAMGNLNLGQIEDRQIVDDLFKSTEKYAKVVKELEPLSVFNYQKTATFYLTMASVTGQVKYVEQALQDLEVAEKLSPNRTQNHWLLAQAYYNLGQIDKAENYLNQAKELNSKQGLTYYYLALLAKEKKNDNKYLSNVRLAIENGYALTNQKEVINLIQIWSQDAKANQDILVKLYQQAKRLDPKDRVAYYNLAKIYEQQGLTTEAIGIWQELLINIPDEMATAQAQIIKLKSN